MQVVTTGDAVNIAQDAATVVGNAFSGFKRTIDFVAVQYATWPNMQGSMMVVGETGSPFSVELTGLQPDTVYYYRAVVCTSGGCYCFGATESFTTLPTPPIPMVITGEAVNIVEDGATIMGNTFSGIFGAIDFVGVQYDTQENMSAPMVAYGTIGSPFSADLMGLQPNTAYYYRAVVGTPGGVYYGAVESFVTPQPLPPPTVITGDATNILQNSATIINNTFSGIVGVIDMVAVQYSTNPSMTGAATSQGAIGSPFSVNLSGLQPNTTYYFRAGVVASSGTYFGQIKSFTTPQVAATVSTGDAINITPSTVVIIGNQFSGISQTINYVGVQHSTSPSMTSATTAIGTVGSPFSVGLTTLQPNTTYYYRAAVSTAGGTYFGEIKSFRTPQRV